MRQPIIAMDEGAEGQRARIIQSPAPDQCGRHGLFAFPDAGDFAGRVFGGRRDLRFVGVGQTTDGPQLLKRQIEHHVD
jgi:hypothetical protein